MTYPEFLGHIRDMCKMTLDDAIVITDVFDKNKKYMCFRVVINYSTTKLSGSKVVNIYVNKKSMRVESYRVDPQFYEQAIEDSIESWLEQLVNDDASLVFDYIKANMRNMNHMVRKNMYIIEKMDIHDRNKFVTYMYDSISNVETPIRHNHCHDDHHHHDHVPPHHHPHGGEIGKILEELAHRIRHIEEELAASRENINGERFKTIGERFDTHDSEVMNLKNTIEILVERVDNITSESGGNGSTGGGDFDENPEYDDAVTTEDITSNITVGGVDSGTVFESGTPLEDVIKSMLVAYIPPNISIKTTPSASVYTNGTIISNLKIIATLTENTNPLTELKIMLNSEVLTTVTTGISEGGVFTYEYDKPIATDTTITATLTDGVETVSATKMLDFTTPYYYGVSDTNDVDNFDNFTELLEVRGTKTKAFTANNQYICFAYDESYGELTSIVDGNGFENIDTFTKSTIDMNGVAYNIYTSNTPVTCTNFKYTFK